MGIVPYADGRANKLLVCKLCDNLHCNPQMHRDHFDALLALCIILMSRRLLMHHFDAYTERNDMVKLTHEVMCKKILLK